MNRKTLLAGAALALAAAAPSFAAEGFHPVIGATFTGGGETLATVYFTNDSSRKISSGGLMQLFGGVEYREAGSNLAFQGTVGYHLDRVSADNGSLSFTRVPFEVLGFWYVNDSFRLGGGLRKATSSELNSSGAADIGDYNLRSSTGLVLQGEYFFGEHLSMLVRYVDESYKSNPLGGKIVGSHGGLGVAYRF